MKIQWVSYLAMVHLLSSSLHNMLVNDLIVEGVPWSCKIFILLWLMLCLSLFHLSLMVVRVINLSFLWTIIVCKCPFLPFSTYYFINIFGSHCIYSDNFKIASPLESEHAISIHLKRITTKIHVIVKIFIYRTESKLLQILQARLHQNRYELNN